MKTKFIFGRKVPYVLPFIPFFFALLRYDLNFIDILVYGIYRSLIPTYGMPLGDGRLYVVIRVHTIAKLLGISDSAVKRARKRLVSCGLIEIRRASPGLTSHTVVREAIFEEASPPSTPTTASNTSAVSSEDASKAAIADSTLTENVVPTENSALAEGAPMPPNVSAEPPHVEGATVHPKNNIPINNMLPLSLPENVTLTVAEYAELKAIIGEHTDAYIARYARKKAVKGYTSHNDYATLKQWWSQDKDRDEWAPSTASKPKSKDTPPKKEKTKVGDAGNSFDTNDFFASALQRSMPDVPASLSFEAEEGAIPGAEVPGHA